jgi:hypothetical protein
MNAESNVSAVSWLHGLQDYLEFSNDKEAKKYVDFFLGLLYSNNAPIDIKDTLDINEFVFQIKKYADNKIIDLIYKYFREGYNPKYLQDAFSRGQVNSKIWLVTELSKIQRHFDMVHIHAGWFGQHRLYLDNAGIHYEKMRIFDIDDDACKVSDTIFNNELIKDYKVKSTTLRLPLRHDSDSEQDMPWVQRTGVEYEVKNYSKNTSYLEKTMPELIINSSAEHMSSIWYHKFINRPMETDPLFVIQTNNLFDVEEHQLCVHSLDHMQKKFPMSRIEYAGEKELYGYKRFMMIGRP